MRKEFISKLRTNDNCKLSEEELGKLPLETLQSLIEPNKVVSLKQQSHPVAQSPEEYIQQAPIEIREVLNEGLRMHREQKEALIKVLKENKNCVFTEEQLKAKDLLELLALAKLAQVEDYSGRAIPGDFLKSVESDRVPDPPKVSELIIKARK